MLLLIFEKLVYLFLRWRKARTAQSVRFNRRLDRFKFFEALQDKHFTQINKLGDCERKPHLCQLTMAEPRPGKEKIVCHTFLHSSIRETALLRTLQLEFHLMSPERVSYGAFC